MYFRYILLFMALCFSFVRSSSQTFASQPSDTSAVKEIVRPASSVRQLHNQFVKSQRQHLDPSRNIVGGYIDSLKAYEASADSVIAMNIREPFRFNPRMYRLFIPLTYYHSASSQRLRLSRGDGSGDAVLNKVDDALMNVYLRRPDLVVNDESRLESVGTIGNKIKKPIIHNVELVDKVAPLPEDPGVAPMDLVVLKPNFWNFKGDCYLQFLQNFVSSNWYKGGENSYSMVGSAAFEFNYNNKSRFKWENKLEAKLGFQTSNGDTLHTFKTSEDLIRYTSKLGLQAHNKWYYTLQMIGTTQFTRGYKENDPEIYSDFMAPFNMNLSLGMDYQVETKNKHLTGNIHLAPVAYNLRYVRDKNLAPRFGIDEDKHIKHDIGSEFVCDLKWIILKNFSWQSRMYGYTTYKRTEFEWENTFTFNFNRYISTKIFVYPRFDDGATTNKQHSYWQFKEFASVGFSYEF